MSLQYCLKQGAWSESDFFVQMTNTSFSALICTYSSENLQWAIFLQTQKIILKKQYKKQVYFVWNRLLLYCANQAQMMQNRLLTYYLNNREEREQLWCCKPQDHVVIIFMWCCLKSNLLGCFQFGLDRKCPIWELPLLISYRSWNDPHLIVTHLRVWISGCRSCRSNKCMLVMWRMTSLSSAARSQTDPIALWMYHS